MIDPVVSEKYLIVCYGVRGFEIQTTLENGEHRMLKIFNEHKTAAENWQDAVEWKEAQQ